MKRGTISDDTEKTGIDCDFPGRAGTLPAPPHSPVTVNMKYTLCSYVLMPGCLHQIVNSLRESISMFLLFFF